MWRAPDDPSWRLLQRWIVQSPPVMSGTAFVPHYNRAGDDGLHYAHVEAAEDFGRYPKFPVSVGLPLWFGGSHETRVCRGSLVAGMDFFMWVMTILSVSVTGRWSFRQVTVLFLFVVNLKQAGTEDTEWQVVNVSEYLSELSEQTLSTRPGVCVVHCFNVY